MHISLLISVIFMLCQQQSTEYPHAHGRLPLSTLLNCTYHVDDFWQAVTLHGGQSSRRVEGFDCLLKLRGQSWGDIDGDGQVDALVILTSEGCGGNGLFFYLAPVLNRNGKPVALNAVELGDRIGVRSLNVRNGTIIAAITTQGPNDAYCCPTMKLTLRLRVVNDSLKFIE